MLFIRTENQIHIGDQEAVGSFVIERGPVKKVETATAALLANDATADHYFEGQRDTGFKDNDGNPVMHTGIDADANEIKTGQPMAYNDWVGFQTGVEGAACYYLYRRTNWTAAEKEEREMAKNAPPYLKEVGTFPTEDEAINAALSA